MTMSMTLPLPTPLPVNGAQPVSPPGPAALAITPALQGGAFEQVLQQIALPESLTAATQPSVPSVPSGPSQAAPAASDEAQCADAAPSQQALAALLAPLMPALQPMLVPAALPKGTPGTQTEPATPADGAAGSAALPLPGTALPNAMGAIDRAGAQPVQLATPSLVPAKATLPQSHGAADALTQDGTQRDSITSPRTEWSGVLAQMGERMALASPSTQPTLALPARSPEQWREPLLNTLGERVQWQIQRGSEQAVIRLEPPHLGRVDIVIRQEAGQMQVHLSATHREVAQQLQGISDGLRTELSLRQAAEVQVQVSDQSSTAYMGQGQRRESQQDTTRDPGRALSEADAQTDADQRFAMNTDLG